MEKKRRVIVYGNTVALAGIEASMILDQGCEVVAHAWPMDRRELCRLDPDVVIFELNAVEPEFPHTLSKELPGLLLIGIDPETNRVQLWWGQQAEGWTSQDLSQAIHQAQFQIPSRAARMNTQWAVESNHRKEIKTMATEKEMYELLGRALTDSQLRAALVEDPVKATKGLGFDLTEEQLAALKASDLGHALDSLDDRLSKYAAHR